MWFIRFLATIVCLCPSIQTNLDISDDSYLNIDSITSVSGMVHVDESTCSVNSRLEVISLEGPVDVRVISAFTAEEIVTLSIKQPISPKKLYAELRREEGLAWTRNNGYFKLLNEFEPLDPLDDQPISLDEKITFKLENYITIQLVEQHLTEDELAFIDFYHWVDNRAYENTNLYNDYFAMYFAVQENGNALQYASNRLVEEDDLCLAAVRNNGYVLACLPGHRKTPEICLAAVENNGFALQCVPKNQLTEKICLAAIKNKPLALKHIPMAGRTSEIYMALVKRQGSLLYRVPLVCRTPDVYLAAVRQNHNTLNQVPLDERSSDLYLAAVKQNCYLADRVPLNKLTPEIYLAAVQNGWPLRSVPIEERSFEICLAAVQKNAISLQHVPPNLRRRQINMTAVLQNGLALVQVPVEERTNEICLAAINQNGWALRFVPGHSLSSTICFTAVDQNTDVISLLSEDQITPEICLAAAQKNYQLTFYLSCEENSNQILMCIINQRGKTIKHLRGNDLIARIHLAVSQRNVFCPFFVPSNRLTEFAEILIRSDNSIEYLPTEIKEKVIEHRISVELNINNPFETICFEKRAYYPLTPTDMVRIY